MVISDGYAPRNIDNQPASYNTALKEDPRRQMLTGTIAMGYIRNVLNEYGHIINSETQTNDYALSIETTEERPKPHETQKEIPETLRKFQGELENVCTKFDLELNYPTAKRIVVSTRK